MPPELSITQPGRPPRRVPLEGAFTIGRGDASDLILKDARASRNHALLRPLGRGYYVFDLGSANGTFLNGRLVTAPVRLKNADVIVIAECTLRFENPGAGGAPENGVDVLPEPSAVLIADIRGFSLLVETMPANELPAFIGGWFRDATELIERHGGVIEGFSGAAVTARWPESRPRGPLDAALELVDAARRCNTRLVALHPALSFAIGCGIGAGVDGERAIVAGDDIRKAAGSAYAFEDLGRGVFAVTRAAV